MRRLMALVAATAVIGGAGIATVPPAAAAKKYTACVKKSTGEMRILLGKQKKCQKGWKKTTWTKAGPKGRKGPAGPDGAAGAPNTFGTLVDANGAEIGRLMGTYTFGLIAFSVRIDGGIYTYYSNGWVLPNLNPRYLDASCTGQPFVTAGTNDGRDELLGNRSLRILYRTTNATLGPPTAYKLVGTAQSLFTAALWERNAAGTCVAVGPYSGYGMPLTEVPSPTDRPGPLSVR